MRTWTGTHVWSDAQLLLSVFSDNKGSFSFSTLVARFRLNGNIKILIKIIYDFTAPIIGSNTKNNRLKPLRIHYMSSRCNFAYNKCIFQDINIHIASFMFPNSL